MPWYQNTKLTYTLIGVLGGLLFPCIAVGIDLYRLDLPLTFANIFQVQINYPTHYIINTAPLVLGLVAYYAGIQQDKIHQLNKELKVKIKDQLQNLQSSNKKLERSLHFKDAFFANMSHEIRTPMNGILGMLDILRKDDTLTDTQLDYILTIYESSASLLRILNEVLDLAKIEAGKMEIIPTETNLHQLIQQVVKVFSATAKQKEVAITYTPQRLAAEWVNVDNTRLSQVLSNLLGNAVKFTEKGSIEVKLQQLPSKGQQALYKLSVCDTGIGISPKNQASIFEEFAQVDYPQAIGSGLGLTISKKITELLGGEIGVESKLGQGSTFWFTFQAQPIDTPTKSLLQFENKTPMLNKHILLVEDNKINQKVACIILKKINCTVDVANDGIEALEKFEPSKYDLILMDIQMPNLNGIEATQNLKAQYTKLPPIVGLSANAMQGDAEKYIAEGLDDYISKPIIIEDLQKIIAKWC